MMTMMRIVKDCDRNPLKGVFYWYNKRVVNQSPMELLIATAIFSCQGAQGLIDNVPAGTLHKDQVIEVIKMSSEKGCFMNS